MKASLSKTWKYLISKWWLCSLSYFIISFSSQTVSISITQKYLNCRISPISFYSFIWSFYVELILKIQDHQHLEITLLWTKKHTKISIFNFPSLFFYRTVNSKIRNKRASQYARTTTPFYFCKTTLMATFYFI